MTKKDNRMPTPVRSTLKSGLNVLRAVLDGADAGLSAEHTAIVRGVLDALALAIDTRHPLAWKKVARGGVVDLDLRMHMTFDLVAGWLNDDAVPEEKKEGTEPEGKKKTTTTKKEGTGSRTQVAMTANIEDAPDTRFVPQLARIDGGFAGLKEEDVHAALCSAEPHARTYRGKRRWAPAPIYKLMAKLAAKAGALGCAGKSEAQAFSKFKSALSPGHKSGSRKPR